MQSVFSQMSNFARIFDGCPKDFWPGLNVEWWNRGGEFDFLKNFYQNPHPSDLLST